MEVISVKTEVMSLAAGWLEVQHVVPTAIYSIERMESAGPR
jgi:hypothetical protein